MASTLPKKPLKTPDRLAIEPRCDPVFFCIYGAGMKKG
jgi:hypothetical protein